MPPTTVMTSGFVTVAANTLLVIHQGSMVITELTLEDGAAITVAPGIPNVQLTVQKMTLHGKSMLDLSPVMDATTHDHAYDKPAEPAQPPQVPPNNPPPPGGDYPRKGTNGTNGLPGHDGLAGIDLTLVIGNLNATDGSLWIRNDGGAGFPGGDGGAGGQGSTGPSDCITNPNGGDGGDGGKGGAGGRGGPPGRVSVTVAGGTITPQSSGLGTPSTRPSEANTVGVIVIHGNGGDSGLAGRGGWGAVGGAGHTGCWLSTDSKSGTAGKQGLPGDSPMPWSR